MRRPRFNRWIRTQVLQFARSRTFNMRRLAAQAQKSSDGALAAALLLYAHENGCLNKLMSYVYDEGLRAEYASVERHLGCRTVERLALRGTPMRSLPDEYCALMEAYDRAYHAPEIIAAEKHDLQRRAHNAILRSGTSPTALAHALGVDPANMHAYLMRGETHRVNLNAARALLDLAG